VPLSAEPAAAKPTRHMSGKYGQAPGNSKAFPVKCASQPKEKPMIDFVSTRETTDPQTAACARLLATVIAHAISDASTPPNREEKKQGRNLNSDAIAAIDFLFGNGSVFPLYADLIGASAESIRHALINVRQAPGLNTRVTYKEEDQRILLIRLRWHRINGLLQ
jgi:hypothetical protein